MKNFLFTYCFSLLSVAAQAQQQWLSTTVNVRDVASNKPIPMGVTSSLRLGKCYAIENGKLELQYNEQVLSDTLFIDVQGYIRYKTTYADLINKGKALLAMSPTTMVLPTSNFSKNKSLNNYDNQAVFHWVGLPINDQPFNYLQVGQIFENSHAGSTLNKIRLNQMIFDFEPGYHIYDDGTISTRGTIEMGKYETTYADYPSEAIFQIPIIGLRRSYMLSYLMSNKFKLRIYQLNINNQPIAELCTSPILIDRTPPVENMHINLSKYKIILPEGKFMVAVEWIPSPKNLNYVSWTKGMYQTSQSLRPFIGVNEKKGEKLNVMALDYGGNWKPFDFLSPYYTDLAMECEIDY